MVTTEESFLRNFDVSHFVNALNRRSRQSEPLLLEPDQQREIRKPVFAIHHYPLEQQMRSIIVQQNHGNYHNRTLAGHILEERGMLEDGDYDPGYESLKVQMNIPLVIDGVQRKPFTIKIYRENDDWCAGMDRNETRVDHERLFGLLWKRANLSSIFPTEMFYPHHNA